MSRRGGFLVRIFGSELSSCLLLVCIGALNTDNCRPSQDYQDYCEAIIRPLQIHQWWREQQWWWTPTNWVWKENFLEKKCSPEEKKEITFLPSATITQSRVPCVGRPTLAGRQQVISCLRRNKYAQVALSCRIIFRLPILIFLCHISPKKEKSWS